MNDDRLAAAPRPAVPSRSGADRPLKYMVQLDGLRALAVAMVFVEHWVPASYRLAIPWGGLGVHLFFVLSGLLITEILLESRDLTRSAGERVGRQLRVFYIRRFLRIFPVFYCLLLFLFAVGYGDIRHSILWHAGYLSNVFVALRGEWAGRVSHFWSLAAEEQFYVLWPWIVLFTPPGQTWAAVVGFISLGPLSRLLFWADGWPLLSISILPLTSFDSLGAGALLALVRTHAPASTKRRFEQILGPAALAAMASFVALLLLLQRGVVFPAAVIANALAAVFLAWVVLRAARGERWPLSRLLEQRGIVYLGQISYGLYLFHNFTPIAYDWTAARFPLLRPLWVRLPGLFAITVAVAALSWRFLEAPINRCKRWFPYQGD